MRTEATLGQREPSAAEVRLFLANYRPRNNDVRAMYARPDVHEYIVRVMLAVPPETVAKLHGSTSFLAQYVAWCVDRGLPLQDDVILDPLMVDEWVASHGGQRTAYRTWAVRRLGRHLTPHHPWPPGRGPKEKRQKVHPYSQAEVDLYLKLARNQSIPARRRLALAMMCLCHGAGLSGGELRFAQAKDVTFDTDGALVEVGEPRPRSVPLRRIYEEDLHSLLHGLGPDDHLTGRSYRSYDASRMSIALDDGTNGFSQMPVVRASRLKATWVVEMMMTPMPLVDLAAWAGSATFSYLHTGWKIVEPSPDQYRHLVRQGLRR